MSDSVKGEEANIETPEVETSPKKNLKIKKRKLADMKEDDRLLSAAEDDVSTHSEESGAAKEAQDSLFFELPDEPFEDAGFGELIFGQQLFPAKKENPEEADPEDGDFEELSDEDFSDKAFPEEELSGEDAAERTEEEEIEELSEAEKKKRRFDEARAERRRALKAELEEQLRLEREEQERIKEEEERERKRQEEKLRKEREKEEERARKEREKQEEKARKEQERAEAKARREQIKQTAEYRRLVKIRRIVMSIVIVIAVIIAAVFLIDRYVRLNQYAVISSIEMTNLDETSKIYPFRDGYVKIAGDGITYFDRGGIIWNESFSMADPLCDVCGDYIVASDMKSTEVSIYGTGGFINKFSLKRVATGVQVSRLGTIAVATNEGESSFIELMDMEGNDLATVKTVFSSTGYLTDIALSDDGSKLAAAFISVVDGNIESKVIFYDFSKDSNRGEDVTIGEFTQYKSSLITSLEFMNGNRLAAVGDNAFTIYSVGDNPSIIYEDLALPWQINSLFFSDRYIGFIVENAEGEDAYAIKAYNLNGRLVCDQSFDFAYNHAAFAGNSVLLYSTYDCDVFNFAGTHKFSYSFDNRIYTMESCGDNINYILLGQGQTQFIRLR